MMIQPLVQQPQTQNAATPPAASSPDNVDENQFLQLLVAQIQYQDPTSPTDSTAFVTQLAQFSSLEQLVAIHTDLDNQASQSTTATGKTDAIQGGS